MVLRNHYEIAEQKGNPSSYSTRGPEIALIEIRREETHMRSSARYRLSVKFLRFRVTIALQLQIDFRHPRVDEDVDAQAVAKRS